MAFVPNTDVVIDGETFNLVTVPNANSKMVQNAKDALLCSLDLASFVDDFGKLGKFIRVAYNGVVENTEIQIKVQRVGYKIMKLADKSAVTVHSFKRVSQNALQQLQVTFQFLLVGMEEIALKTLSLFSSVAAGMAEAAEELHNGFEKAMTDVIDVLEDTQRAKGTQEARKKALEKERKEFEIKKQKAEELQKSALEAEEKAKASYSEAQAREDKAMEAQGDFIKVVTCAVTGIFGAVGAAARLDFQKALENVGSKEVMKMANNEKKRHLDDMDKQRQIRQDALLQCIEFTEKTKSCKDDDALADAAIEALHSSIGTLKSLSAIMICAALFWQQMQIHCESLAKGDMQQLVEKAMKYPEEKRLNVWTSRGFKVKAVQYYSKWVALDDVCEVYMLQIKDTRQDLYSYLEENPTIEQAKKNVRQLADTFAADLKKAREKLGEKQQKALEEKKTLENSE